MINQAFAEQFIRRIRSQTDYNINIMNEHGIIIASCSEERVGTFHATAFRMITNNISINVTEDLTEDLPGVTSPGVNLLLRENLIPVGVIGVSGDPSTVMSLAKLIKLSFESLYDYELQREFLPTASTGAMSHLARLLFVDRPVNIMRIRSQAAELGITEHVNRYPLLIEYVGCESSELVLSRFAEDYPNSPSHSPNDLLSVSAATCSCSSSRLTKLRWPPTATRSACVSKKSMHGLNLRCPDRKAAISAARSRTAFPITAASMRISCGCTATARRKSLRCTF